MDGTGYLSLTYGAPKLKLPTSVGQTLRQAMGILLLTNGDVVFEVEEEPSEPKLCLGQWSFLVPTANW